MIILVLQDQIIIKDVFFHHDYTIKSGVKLSGLFSG